MSPRPLAPWPFRRNRVPSSVPGGMVIVRCFCARTSPEPWQVGQRCAGTLPRPRHTGHGRCTAKPPCPNEIVPRPLHSGHVENVVPGAPPEPLQVGQTWGSVSVTGTFPPSAATRNGIEIAVSISSSSSSGAPAPRRPKIDENRSPSPPNEPRSDRSKSTSGPGAVPPPAPPCFASLPLQHNHPRRSDERVAHSIPRLQHRSHGVILRRIVGGSRRDRLVHVGIERDPHLIDPRDARRLQRLPHLPFHHVHTVVDRLGVGLCRIDVREARQIVDRKSVV